jgi:hypothetical protein
MWTEWHVCKQKFSAWHIGVYKIFCGIRETTIFFNGMCVNHSVVYPTHGCCDSLGRQLLFFFSIKIFRIFYAAMASYRFRTIAVVGEGCGGGAGYAV